MLTRFISLISLVAVQCCIVFSSYAQFNTPLCTTSVDLATDCFETNFCYSRQELSEDCGLHEFTIDWNFDANKYTADVNVLPNVLASIKFRIEFDDGSYSPWITLANTNYTNNNNGTVYHGTQIIQHSYATGTGYTPVIHVEEDNTSGLSLSGNINCTTGINAYTTTLSSFNVTTLNIGNVLFGYSSSCNNNIVTYTNGSTVSGSVTYQWDMGDGSALITNNSMSPFTHPYNAPGSYYVTLYATIGSGGNTCSKIYSETVDVGSPQVNFYAVEACLGIPTTFTSSAANATTYYWDYGDGNGWVTGGQNASFLYGTTGTKTVKHKIVVGTCTSAEVTHQVEVHPVVSMTVSGPQTLCAGSSGTYSASGTGNPSYVWEFPSSSGTVTYSGANPPAQSFSGLTAGNYLITVTASNGYCSDEELYPLSIVDPPNVQVNSNPTALCPGDVATLDAYITNYQSSNNYSYSWSTGSNNWQITTSQAGTYTVTVDIGVCPVAIDDITITSEATGTFSLAVTDATCASPANGSIDLTATGANSPSYSWSNGATTEDISGLTSGTYVVTITEGACETVLSAYVEDESFTVNTALLSGSVCSTATGSVQVIPTSGSGYQYNWGSSWTSTATNSNLTAGTYTVSITNTNCTIAHSYTVPSITPTVSIDPGSLTACNGSGSSATVEATLNVSQSLGGNVAFAWPGTTGNDNTHPYEAHESFTAGTYTLTVTIPGGCTIQQPFTVNEVTPISATVSTTPESCLGNDATILAAGQNGVVPYTYAWTAPGGPLAGPSLANLSAGTYTLTLTDGNGCTNVSSHNVGSASAVSIVFNGGYCDNASVTVSGGTPDYTIQWILSGSTQLTQFATSAGTVTVNSSSGGGQNSTLNPGSYTVVVTDANGCTDQVAATIDPSLDRKWEIAFVWTGKPVSNEIEEIPFDNDIASDVAADILNSVRDKMAECEDLEADRVVQAFKNCQKRNNLEDDFSVSYEESNYAYTLYYYDRAGNLTKTVPPEGVVTLTDASITSPSQIEDVIAHRNGTGGAAHVPAHTLTTTYEYNSLAQLTDQQTPDGGITEFVYNDIGQLRFSQNARQAAASQPSFSYTKYDELGRILEVGEAYLSDNSVSSFNDLDQVSYLEMNFNDPYNSFPHAENHDITRTVYTDQQPVDFYGKEQQNLLNRISHVYTDPDGDLATVLDQSHTYYSYDPHGNVEWLIQRVPGFTSNYLRYEYDLVSGNVKEVFANEYRIDKFFHRYEYDADNRITDVFTSRDGQIWDRDASYHYYAHGPLRRVETGEDDLQGTDYVYTIEGWLKGINATDLVAESDPGGDRTPYYDMDLSGTNAISVSVNSQPVASFSYNGETPQERIQLLLEEILDNYDPSSPDPEHHIRARHLQGEGATVRLFFHQGSPGLTVNGSGATASLPSFASDVMAMELSYYQGDFTREDHIYKNTAGGSAATAVNGMTGAQNLYNGNIAAWSIKRDDVTGTGGVEKSADLLTGRVFTYDKLNRLTSASYQEYSSGAWQTNTNDEYASAYTYDLNGNIQSLFRNTFIPGTGSAGDQLMDNLTYAYNPGTNQLSAVGEGYTTLTVGNQGEVDIIGNTSYQYDPTGNLTQEIGQHVIAGTTYTYQSDIEWNTYGKVARVTKDNGDGSDDLVITFMYDAGGNRVRKEVKKDGWQNGTHPDEHIFTTYYVRDAGGNVMGTYERTNTWVTGTTYNARFYFRELPIYGTSRVGMFQTNSTQDDALLAEIEYDNTVSYELSFEVNGMIEKTENYHLISPANQAITELLSSFDNTEDQECLCELRELDVENTTDQIIDKFSGLGYNDIAIGEDLDGKPLFYYLNIKDYMGEDNVPLVLDKEGELMKGLTDGAGFLKAEPNSKATVMMKPGATDEYYLFTRHLNAGTGELYLHRIKPYVPGYGASGDNRGELDQINVLLDNSGDHYGRHMAVLEDGIHDKFILYASRYVPPQYNYVLGTREIVAFKFDGTTLTPTPQVVATLPSYDGGGDGELQLNRAGTHLLVYNHEFNVSGFDHKEIEVMVYKLNPNKVTVETGSTLSIPGNLAGNFRKAAAEFTYEAGEVNYNQRQVIVETPGGGSPTPRLQREYTASNGSILLGTMSYGDVRRGMDQDNYTAPQDEDLYISHMDVTNTQTNYTWTGATIDHEHSGHIAHNPIRLHFPTVASYYTRTLEHKQYEINDHLGNVHVVIADFKDANSFNGSNQPESHSPVSISQNDYYPFGMIMDGREYQSSQYRYGFNNQERDEEIGLGHYTAEFWQYDSRLARRWNLDPVQQVEQSDYAVLNNNPINSVDPFGDDPTDKEAALMSDDVYNTSNGKYKEGASANSKLAKSGWSLCATCADEMGVKLTEDESGFNSAIYTRGEGDNIEYAYVTQGTDMTSGVDWENNKQQAMGEESRQYRLSTINAQAIYDRLGEGADMTYTGHSLGGGLASANALKTGYSAITFNAAGLHDNSRKKYGLNQVANIRAYVVEGEIVHSSQKLLGLKAEGKITFLPASYIPMAPLYFAPPQVRTAAMITNAGLSGWNHTMGRVLTKMDEEGIK